MICWKPLNRVHEITMSPDASEELSEHAFAWLETQEQIDAAYDSQP
jgi:hypothetical protein